MCLGGCFCSPVSHVSTMLPSNLLVICCFPLGRSRSFRLRIWELWRDWSVRQRNETKKYNLGIVESSSSNNWLKNVCCLCRQKIARQKHTQNNFNLKLNRTMILHLKMVWLIKMAYMNSLVKNWRIVLLIWFDGIWLGFHESVNCTSEETESREILEDVISNCCFIAYTHEGFSGWLATYNWGIIITSPGWPSRETSCSVIIAAYEGLFNRTYLCCESTNSLNYSGDP